MREGVARFRQIQRHGAFFESLLIVGGLLSGNEGKLNDVGNVLEDVILRQLGLTNAMVPLPQELKHENPSGAVKLLVLEHKSAVDTDETFHHKGCQDPQRP